MEFVLSSSHPARPLRTDARRNREALLRVAREAFLAAEPDVGVDEIARRAGVSVGTLYRHFETREALVEQVWRSEVEALCAAPDQLLALYPPDRALREFLLLIVDHAAVGKGMSDALRSLLATDSPVFDDARIGMSEALDRMLAEGVAAGLIRAGVGGRTMLRAMGTVCGMSAIEGWQAEAVQITTILYDGLRNTE